jgi:hypothetical protein
LKKEIDMMDISERREAASRAMVAASPRQLTRRGIAS